LTEASARFGASCVVASDVRERPLRVDGDEWAVRRARYMTLETMAPLSDDPIFKLPAVAA
jgi:hypothetical protein